MHSQALFGKVEIVHHKNLYLLLFAEELRVSLNTGLHLVEQEQERKNHSFG